MFQVSTCNITKLTVNNTVYIANPAVVTTARPTNLNLVSVIIPVVVVVVVLASLLVLLVILLLYKKGIIIMCNLSHSTPYVIGAIEPE